MPYPDLEDAEKLRLNVNRCLKLPHVADMVRKTKACWDINPDMEQTGNDYIKAKTKIILK